MFVFTKPATSYQKLDQLEARDHLLQSTGRNLHQHRRREIPRTAFYGLSILNVLVLIITISLWLPRRIDTNTDISPPNKILNIPYDQKTIFQPSAEFELPNNNSDHDPWNSLQPTGRGFVVLPTTNPHTKAVQNQYFCISMFHQLHCVASLQAAFKARSSGYDHMKTHDHLAHCFDYLRQAIMCTGDMTLEPAFEINDTRGVDGWGVLHQCRDYEKIKAFAEERRFVNSSGIL